jgi:hypothetical protein
VKQEIFDLRHILDTFQVKLEGVEQVMHEAQSPKMGRMGELSKGGS